MPVRLVRIKPSRIQIHPLHPATGLSPAVRNRLVNLGLDRELLRRIASIEICQLAIVRKRPYLIVGWHLWAAMRYHGIDDPILCLEWESLSPNNIEEMVLADLALRPQLSRSDEVARRLLAVLELQRLGPEHFSRRRLLRIKKKFSLPTRKRNTLQDLLKNEHESVWSMIMEAPKPVGGTSRTKHQSTINFPEQPQPIRSKLRPPDQQPGSLPASARQPSLFSDCDENDGLD